MLNRPIRPRVVSIFVHPLSVSFVCNARINIKRGDYVIVGIHGDTVVNKRRGGNLPLMNLHERLLSVLGCKFMNDVLIDAPAEITPDMIASLRITEVVHGTESDHNGLDANFGEFSFVSLNSLFVCYSDSEVVFFHHPTVRKSRTLIFSLPPIILRRSYSLPLAL